MKTRETILTGSIGVHPPRVALNRPEEGNAENPRIGLDPPASWTRPTDDPGEVRRVILTAAAEPSFRAGGDLKQMDPKRGFMFEIEAYDRLGDTEDRREGVPAFNENRVSRFEGQ